MITPHEFRQFVESLENPVVQMDESLHTIDLKTLTKDTRLHHDFREWWKSKNMPKHLNNTIIKTILNTNPPENIRTALLFMML